MTWNYRVCKTTYTGEGFEEVNYEIHEAYYNKDGSIWAVTQNAVAAHAESVQELKEVLSKMAEALNKPVIDLDDYTFAPRKDDKEVEETKLV